MINVTTKSKTLEELITGDISRQIPKNGDLVKGRIIALGKNEVIVDIEGLTTGLVRGWEMEDESGDINNLKLGDEVTAVVMELENERGMIELSFRAAGHQKAWDELEQLKKDNTTVSVRALDANRGGLIVKLGNVLGFLPVSQLSSEHYPRVEGGNKNKILDKLKSYINKNFEAKLIDVNEVNEKLIVSEKAVEEVEQIKAIAGYEIGEILEVDITGIVDFGLFVELPVKEKQPEGPDKIEGLIHVSELAWQRVEDPRQLYKIGDRIKAKIIEIKGSKISLSIRQLMPDPWQKAGQLFKVGDIIKGKILKINDFGAFVEATQQIHGLAHTSELQAADQLPLQVGEQYEFKITHLDPPAHRMGLSRKIVNEPQTDEPDVKKEVIAAAEQTLDKNYEKSA